MRILSIPWVVFLIASLLSTSSTVAQEQKRTINDDLTVSSGRRLDLDRESERPTPPAPPLRRARASMRGPIHNAEMHAVNASDAPGVPGETTVFLELSAGLSIVSLPLRVQSEKLSDIFPNLPEGSRAWIWDVSKQRFVEGFDSELPLGHACWLYVPFPVLLTVTGTPNLLQDVSVDIEKGWNLIGVPYGTALLRSQQEVYVDFTRKRLNDAVAARDLGPVIYSLDVNGYQTVDEDGSFEPLHGYWVYARRAELLELKRPSLSDPAGFAIPWGSVVQMAAGTILTDMGYGDTAKLNQILGKLDTITATQAALSLQLANVLNEIHVDTDKILKAISDSAYVGPVQTSLHDHYDEENPLTSFAWFVEQARQGAGPSVSMTTKSDFAGQVLDKWDFIHQFNLIYTGIAPAASEEGLLDNFADMVALSAGEYDLKQRYMAMQTYFNTLLGMQIKCATLIMNAYNQLGNDPAFADHHKPSDAADWKKKVFDPVIKEETLRFLHAVEGMAVKKLPVPQTWSDPVVKLPDNVQVVMGLADLYVMETLKQIYPELEPPGVRVRFVLNPGAGTDLPTVTWLRYGVLEWPHSAQLPSFDTWQTYPGARDYDDWVLPKQSNTRAFNVTSNWKMARIILPVTVPCTVIMTAGGDSVWWSFNRANATVAATLDQSGTLFGSVTLAQRPSTRDVFDPCMGWPITTEWTQNCWSILGLSDCDRGAVDSCNRRSFHPAKKQSTLTMKYTFTYQGDIPKQGTWKANGEGAVTDNTACDWSRLYYELFKGDAVLDSTLIDRAHTNQVQTVQVTWQPGQTYVAQVRLQPVADAYSSCIYYWTYKGAQMTFP